MNKREEGKWGKFPWGPGGVSESEPEPEEEERMEFREYPQRLLSDAQMALRQVHLYENDRKNIPPHLAPYLLRYFEHRLGQELKGNPLSIDLFPITLPDYDASSDFHSSSEEEEEEEEAKALEPATTTHDGKTATPPRDGKRSHSRDGNGSSRDGKRCRRH